MPCVMSHISCVQTLVNANGKNRSNVFFLPKLPLSFTSTSPEACLDLRLKSGALVPTEDAIGFFFDFELQIFFRYAKLIWPVPSGVKLRFIQESKAASTSPACSSGFTFGQIFL